jgi:hypothetical protein
MYGGTAIYVKNNINVIQRKDIEEFSEELHFEVCGIEARELNTVYCCLYRSPNGDWDILLKNWSHCLIVYILKTKNC